MPEASATIAALYRYPVKGLSPEPLGTVAVAPGGVLPFDRAYAIENGPSGFDPAAPRPLPKIAFLMLMRNARLAGLATTFDDATGVLTVRRDGAVVASGCLETDEGRRAIEAFFEDFAGDELRGPARVVRAPGHSFSDAGSNFVSVINLATVRAIAERIGAPVHPLRFRGNVYVEGLPAWAEFDWLGRRVRGGRATLEGVERINRCAATNVNPETAERDLAIPRSLLEAWGHPDCGVYCTVVEGGEMKVGDRIGPA